jgi:signal transduction histidine kinase
MLDFITSLSVKWKVILPVAVILVAAFAVSAYVLTDLAARDLAARGRTEHALRMVLGAQVAALVLVVLAIALLVHAAVHYPIARLIRTMGRVERGDLSARARVRAHDEIGRLRERFNHMVQQIAAQNLELARAQQQLAQSERLASIGLLAAGVAHEINNPLATISMAAESLHESAADERERNLARAVLDQAGRISEIVGQLLSFDYSRPPDLAAADVRDVMEEALASVPMGEVRISRYYEPHVPRVRMERDHLRQAFANIVRNALDAMGGRGELAVAAGHRGGEVEVSITDTGPGIPPDHRGRVFDPFFTTKEVGEGTGLGLAIAYQVVRMHQGEIYVQSPAAAPGADAGARFVIRLPAAGRSEDETRA